MSFMVDEKYGNILIKYSEISDKIKEPIGKDFNVKATPKKKENKI